MAASEEIVAMPDGDVVQTAHALRYMFNDTEFRHLIQELLSVETDHVGASTELAPGQERHNQATILWGGAAFSCVCALMEPTLWGALPTELLELIFARLPLPEIFHLRTLSKQWNRSFTSENSMFMQACIDANAPTMFGMISEHAYISSFVHHAQISVRLFDRKSSRWCSAITATAEPNLTTMCAGDGGLLCNLYTAIDVEKKVTPTVVTVWNPLTRVSRELEPVPVPDATSYAIKGRFYPDMIQLVMAEDRSSYKVLVVGETLMWVPIDYEGVAKKQKVAVVYCSLTGEWSPAEGAFPRLIHGSQFQWAGIIKYDWDPQEKTDISMAKFYVGPCAYDCAGQELLQLEVSCDPCTGAAIESFAFVKDHLFVLQEHLVDEEDEDEGSFYCVCEYQCVYLGEGKVTWAKVKCHPVMEVLRYLLVLDDDEKDMKLYACSGFLVLVATKQNDDDDPYRTLLYDLSTSKWQEIPELPSTTLTSGDMFELRLDAVP